MNLPIEFDDPEGYCEKLPDLNYSLWEDGVVVTINEMNIVNTAMMLEAIDLTGNLDAWR